MLFGVLNATYFCILKANFDSINTTFWCFKRQKLFCEIGNWQYQRLAFKRWHFVFMKLTPVHVHLTYKKVGLFLSVFSCQCSLWTWRTAVDAKVPWAPKMLMYRPLSPPKILTLWFVWWLRIFQKCRTSPPPWSCRASYECTTPCSPRAAIEPKR